MSRLKKIVWAVQAALPVVGAGHLLIGLRLSATKQQAHLPTVHRYGATFLNL